MGYSRFDRRFVWQLRNNADVAHERLGMLYEEMGERDKAAAAYGRFIDAWEDADPQLQDRVEIAERRLHAIALDER